MAPTLPPTLASVENSGQLLSTPAIVMIAVGGYMTVVIVALIIRQCLKSRGISICPDWLSEWCCCGGYQGERSACAACFVSFAEMCDCQTPSKKSCMDTICPTRQWCDKTFCCCMNAEPGGDMCQDCQGPACDCGACNCNCSCNLPECNSINCLCFEIGLGSPSVPAAQQTQMHQQIPR